MRIIGLLRRMGAFWERHPVLIGFPVGCGLAAHAIHYGWKFTLWVPVVIGAATVLVAIFAQRGDDEDTW